MKVLHLMSSGGVGGIEVLCLDIAKNRKESNGFCFLMSGGIIADAIEETGCSVYRLYKCRTELEKLFLLFQLVKKEKYTGLIEHHEGLRIFLYYIALLYKFPRICAVKYLHSAFEEKYYYTGKKASDFLMRRSLKIIMKKSHKIIGVSQFVLDSFKEHFTIDDRKMRLIYNGISREYFVIEGNPMSQMADFSKIELLYIGRLVEAKGIELLLSAINDFRKEQIPLHLTIVGEGPQMSVYKKFVKQHELAQEVTFEGRQMDKIKYFQKAHIFVYPSICQEAFGISVLEAMASGLICVASANGGIPELIDDPVNGFLVQNISRETLYDSLKKAIRLCHSRNVSVLCQAAQLKAKQFTIEKTLMAIDDIMQGGGQDQ